MIRLVPVIKLARGLARNTTALATSSGVPTRPIGILASIEANISGLRSSTMFQTPPLKYTLPGETIFARTFFAARLRARPHIRDQRRLDRRIGARRAIDLRHRRAAD